MTSPTSDKKGLDVAGHIVLVVIFLIVISTIIVIANDGHIPLSVQIVPSDPTQQARIDALETQVAQLSHENSRTGQGASTPAPTRTQQPISSQNLIVIVGAANVRAGPGIDHEVLAVVKQGQTVRCPYYTQKGWHQVCCVDGGKRGWISGELVTEQDRSVASAPANSTRTPRPTRTPTPKPADAPTLPSLLQITSPPPSIGAAPLYTKYLDANGAHILATVDVADLALPQARDALLGMTSTRPDLFAAMTGAGLKIIIFDHHKTDLSEIPELADWPPSHMYGVFVYDAAGYTIVVPEYRLKCDVTLVHEIAHAIDYAITPGASWFTEKRDSAYQKAMTAGTWKGDYAETDKHEYWAVAVGRHFRRQAGQTALSEQDPAIAELVNSVFGDAQIPLCP